ncbi:MAG: hypothetical protein WCA76_20490, partial [Candidatus Sulfotelmatobacter sp.]
GTAALGCPTAQSYRAAMAGGPSLALPRFSTDGRHARKHNRLAAISDVATATLSTNAPRGRVRGTHP